MKNFKKWNKKNIEDWGSVMSDDGKAFYKAFKGYLKRSFPDAEIIGFKPNHYNAFGFVKYNDKYIYISHNIDRYRCHVDFDDTSTLYGVLYRTAKNEKDYTGGRNHFTSINCLVDEVNDLLALY